MAKTSRAPRPVYRHIWTDRDGTSDRCTFECAACPAHVKTRLVAGGLVHCWRCGTRHTIERTANQWGREQWVARVGGGRIETMDAQEIFVALQQRHPEPDWVFMPQVRTKTGFDSYEGAGFDSVRYLDALAMHCHESKGLRRVGYEIKVDRGDWLRELEDPRKRAQGFFLCHEFWFAVAPGVYRAGDEVDVSIRGKKWTNALDGCGILEVQEDGTLREIRRATKRQAWPMPDTFVASLLRHYVAARMARLVKAEKPDMYVEPEIIEQPTLGLTRTA